MAHAADATTARRSIASFPSMPTRLAPMVSWGTSPEDSSPIDGAVPDPSRIDDADRRRHVERALDYMQLRPATPLAEVSIDRVFIGSCTNSRIEDLRAAAHVLKGRRAVVPGMVSPGSSAVKRQAEAEGLDRIFIDAGLEWREFRLLDVQRLERRTGRARRALRLDDQPQFRRPPGPRRAHAHHESRPWSPPRRCSDGWPTCGSCREAVMQPFTVLTAVAAPLEIAKRRHRDDSARPLHAPPSPARARLRRSFLVRSSLRRSRPAARRTSY